MKYIVLLVVGLRARLVSSSCAAEESAFQTCYTAATDLTYDGNPFTYWEDDDESLSLPDCAGASATFDDRCANGPAECPAEYEAWVRSLQPASDCLLAGGLTMATEVAYE